MTLRLVISIFICYLSAVHVFGQGIRGRITNDRGEAVANDNIYIPQLSTDTTINNKANYIPLTEKEKISFTKRNSFLAVLATAYYNDSVRIARRKFKMKQLLPGKTYNYSIDSIRQFETFTIPKLINPALLSFNSVDGLRLELPFNYTRSDSSGHLLRLEPLVAYAFARQKVDASFSYNQRLNGMTNTWIGASLGSTTEDFNRDSGLSRMTNDLYTLWREENYKRFYRRDFVQMSASSDLVNGLNLKATIEYNDNSALTNHSTFTILKRKDREILPNIPANREIQLNFPEPNAIEPFQLQNHQSFISRLELEYTPHQRYQIINHTKMYAESKLPTFSLGYNVAYNEVFGSDARFDLMKLGIRQKVKVGVADQFLYQVNVGKFINTQKLYFEEFQHFNTQPTNFMFSTYDTSFRLLPFYQYSTGSQFAEAHTEWQSQRLILKLLPLFKKSSVTEKLFVNYLSTPEIENYVETGYGINNLFILLNIEAVAGFENGQFKASGIKVSLNLNALENKE